MCPICLTQHRRMSRPLTTSFHGLSPSSPTLNLRYTGCDRYVALLCMRVTSNLRYHMDLKRSQKPSTVNCKKVFQILFPLKLSSGECVQRIRCLCSEASFRHICPAAQDVKRVWSRREQLPLLRCLSFSRLTVSQKNKGQY